jgi:hypothetical protein
VSTVSTMKKYLGGWGEGVRSAGPEASKDRPCLLLLSLPLPYDEIKVRTSKHEQTQQCGDGPISHWGKCVLQGTGSPQIPATLGGQEALGEQSSPGVPPLPTMASSSLFPTAANLFSGLTRDWSTEDQVN